MHSIRLKCFTRSVIRNQIYIFGSWACKMFQLNSTHLKKLRMHLSELKSLAKVNNKGWEIRFLQVQKDLTLIEMVPCFDTILQS